MKHQIKTYISLLLFLIVISARADLPVPVLSCVSVENSGDLTVYWSITPADPFDGFRVYYRAAGSTTSNSMDAANTDNSLTITGVSGQTVSYEIYMVSYTIGAHFTPSVQSNTVRNMLLVVSNYGTGNGIARLDWNRIQAGNNGMFNIYRRELTGTFALVGSSVTNVYFDTITTPYCTATDLYYRVEFSSGTCVANSSVASGSFQDDNLPDDPVITNVSIDASGQAVLNWTHSPTADVNGYIVGVWNGSIFNDYYETGYTNSFTDNQTTLPDYHDPCAEVVKYVLRAKDVCGNSSSGAINYSKPHNTILLSGETESQCKRKASLTWNRYNNMNPEVGAYKILRSEAGGSFTEIASIEPGSASTFSFTDNQLLTAGIQYAYRVVAHSADQTLQSSSCTVVLVPDPEPFLAFNLDVVSVTNNNYITLSLQSESPDLISTIEIWRSSTNPVPDELLSAQNWSPATSVLLPDNSAMVNESSYYYTIKALDPCGFELGSTQVGRSIFLQIQDIGNDQYRLSWNGYEDWGNRLLGYNIYRLSDGVIESGYPKPIASNVLVYTENGGVITGGRTTFYVEALRNDDVVSLSNEVVLPADADIKVPTAFRPGGISPVFRPLVKNIESGSFSFAVYNRWGQQVYASNDPTAGWDGQYNGNNAMQDVYAWIITYTDYNGQTSSKRGSVLLLR